LRRVELGEIAEVFGGYAFKSKDFNETSGVPVIKISNIQGGEVSEKTLKEYLPDSYLDDYENYQIRRGDILVALSGATTGKTGVYNLESKSLLNQRVGLVRAKNGHADQKYLSYYVSKITDDILNKAQGVAQPNISTKELAKFEIPLPSLSEQKAIVAKLDRAQRLIDIDREMLAKYDELIQSVFLEMFGDPVRNEKGWEVKKLGNVGTLARGKSKHRPRNDPSILGGEYPLIQTGDVANAGLFITEYSSTYNEAGLKQSKLWDNGTLCITIAANIAKVGILDFDACFPDSVVGFKSEKASSIFIYAWMGFLQNIIEEQAPVSAQKNINLRILNDLDIIFPPLSLQREYEQIVLKVDRERKEIENLNQKSEELFSSLVQGVFG